VRRPEEQLHRSVAQLLRTAAPELLWWSTPNQRGTRKRWEMGVLYALGVKSGVPDICIVLPGGQLGCIELKAKGGALTDSQKAFGQHLKMSGGLWACCRSLDEVIITLEAWGVPLRIAA
jgi:hypothetical protein